MEEFPKLGECKTDDERFMLFALQEAQKAFKKGEVPVGAVLVHEGRVIARGHNQVEMLRDATAHAEMLAITAGANHFENWRLLDTVLYTTLEPCPMCFGALLLSRVKKVVYAAKDLRHGACGSWVNLLEKPHPTHDIEVDGGVFAEVSSRLMQDFFRKRRLKA